MITCSALYKKLQQQLADANSQAQVVLRQLAEAQTAKHEYLRLQESKAQQAEVRAGCLAATTYCCLAMRTSEQEMSFMSWKHARAASLCNSQLYLCWEAPLLACAPLQGERILRSQVLHLQQQVNELNAKQVDLLGQKQQLQVGGRSAAQRSLMVQAAVACTASECRGPWQHVLHMLSRSALGAAGSCVLPVFVCRRWSISRTWRGMAI
jgi:hypothetical protein